jgi:hypothetical protein
MKKILAIIVLSVIFTSCQKENIELSTTQEEVYIQVEAVHDDGSSVYSNISMVR